MWINHPLQLDKHFRLDSCFNVVTSWKNRIRIMCSSATSWRANVFCGAESPVVLSLTLRRHVRLLLLRQFMYWQVKACMPPDESPPYTASNFFRIGVMPSLSARRREFAIDPKSYFVSYSWNVDLSGFLRVFWDLCSFRIHVEPKHEPRDC